MQEKEMGAGSAEETSQETAHLESHVDDDSDASSVSTSSTSSRSHAEERIQLQRTLSRNAGLDEHDKGTAGMSRVTSVATNMTSDPRFEVDFDDGEHPQDWSMLKKGLVMLIMSYSTLVVVMYSTSYTSGNASLALNLTLLL
jgi:hypothetical protein